MARSNRDYAGCGAVVLLGIAAFALMMMKISSCGVGRASFVVDAPIEDAMGLSTGAVVAVAGVPVGTIQALAVEGDHAVARLSVWADSQLRRDVRVRVRARSLLGEKYIELIPQSADAPLLKQGDTLAFGGSQVEIDEMVALLAPLLEAVDPALVATLSRGLSEELEKDPARLGRLLASAEELLANTSAASKDLPQTMRAVRATLAKIDARAQEARGAIAESERLVRSLEDVVHSAPLTLTKANAALDKADVALDTVNDALAPMNEASADLAHILENFEDFDEETLRMLLREEGVRVHLFGKGKKSKAK